MSYNKDSSGRRIDSFVIGEDALRHMNVRPIADARCNPGAQSALAIAQSQSSRINVIPAVSSSHIVLVFANITGSNGLGEWGGDSTVWVSASLEYLTPSGVNSETGLRVPARFSGALKGEMAPRTLLFSDPIPFDATAGTAFFVRVNMQTAGANLGQPVGFAPQGSTAAGGLNNGDAATSFAAVQYGSLGTGSLLTSTYPGPVAVLGYVRGKAKSMTALGDSILAGTGDSGYGRNDGGWATRIINGQLSRAAAYPYTPQIAGMRLARGGETLAQFLTQAGQLNQALNSEIRVRLGGLSSTVLFEYGTNDLASSLASIQANYVQAANSFLRMGKRFIASTLLPKTTSTDGWATTANQTVTANEATRTAFNTWLRNGKFAAATAVPGECRVFDAALAVEVNAAGVSTANGGFWKPAPGGVSVTGTLTAGSTSALLNDTGKAWTQDQWRGYGVQYTSGALAGTLAPILSNTATALTLASSGTNPATGDAYKITDAYTVDGTHPLSGGHAAIASAFDLTMVN